MQEFTRSYESSFEDKGDLVGRVFKWDTESYCEGMPEVIPRSCKITVGKNCMALLSHKKESMLGRHNQNLSFEEKEDGLYFRIKKVPTQLFQQAKELVQNKIIGGVSPGFSARPVYEKGRRIFKELFLSEISLVGNPAYSHSEIQVRENKTLRRRHLPPECYK